MDAKGLIATLIKLSKSDHYFDQFELTYILKVGAHLGLDNELVEQMINQNNNTDIEIPEKEQDRMTLLYYMLFLMKIDTIVTDEEKDMIHHYGFKFGFSKPMMDEFISVIEAHKFRKVPPEKMIQIITKYQN